MSFRRIVTIVALLSLLSLPVLAAEPLTPYQQGVYDGLKAGLTIGRALGAAPYDNAQQQQYNKMVDSFNKGLSAIFGDNQTAIGMFWLTDYSTTSGGTSTLNPYGTVTNKLKKPIHSIDGSWNQSQTTVPAENPSLRYGDMPLSAVYTWMDQYARDSKGNILYDPNGNPIGNPSIPSVAAPGAGDAMGGV